MLIKLSVRKKIIVFTLEVTLEEYVLSTLGQSYSKI